MTDLKDCNLSVLNNLHGDRAPQHKHKDHFTPITVQLLHIDTIIAASLVSATAEKLIFTKFPEREEQKSKQTKKKTLQPPNASLLIIPQFCELLLSGDTL